MKRKAIITVSIVLVTLIGITVAQTVMGNKKPKMTPEKKAELQTKKMTDIYQLTEDQQKQVYLVNLDFQKKVSALNEDKNNSGTQKSGENYLRDEHEKSIYPILNENQKIKWDQHKEYRKKNPKVEKTK